MGSNEQKNIPANTPLHESNNRQEGNGLRHARAGQPPDYPYLPFPLESTWLFGSSVQSWTDPLFPRDENGDYVTFPESSASNHVMQPANSSSRHAIGSGILDWTAPLGTAEMSEDHASLAIQADTQKLLSDVSGIDAMLTQFKETVENKMNNISNEHSDTAKLIRRRTNPIPTVLEKLTEQQVTLRELGKRQEVMEQSMLASRGDVLNIHDAMRHLIHIVGPGPQKYDFLVVKLHAIWKNNRMAAARALVTLTFNTDYTLATYEKTGRHAVRKSLVYTDSTRVDSSKAVAEAYLDELAGQWEQSLSVKASVSDQDTATPGREVQRCACISNVTSSDLYHHAMLCSTRRYAQEIALVLAKKLGKRHLSQVTVVTI